MSVAKYQAFLTVVEHGNITQAAEAMGYTQSAVSRIIADLELTWDVQLLTRGRTGVVLTSAGEELLPYLRAVCNAQKELEERVGELHGLTKGTIRIGTFSSVSIHWLPSIMSTFLVRYPDINFHLRTSMEYAEIEDWVANGEVDCGFIGLPATQKLDTIFLCRDRILAILPPDHPLADAPSYPISRFGEESFIRLDEDRDREYVRIFDACGMKPAAQYSVNDDNALVAMAASGLGVSLLPELVLQGAAYHVVAKPLDPPCYRDIGLALRHTERPSPATTRFVAHVQDWISQYSGGKQQKAGR